MVCIGNKYSDRMSKVKIDTNITDGLWYIMIWFLNISQKVHDMINEYWQVIIPTILNFYTGLLLQYNVLHKCLKYNHN